MSLTISNTIKNIALVALGLLLAINLHVDFLLMSGSETKWIYTAFARVQLPSITAVIACLFAVVASIEDLYHGNINVSMICVKAIFSGMGVMLLLTFLKVIALSAGSYS
jgi:hypothetical protein